MSPPETSRPGRGESGAALPRQLPWKERVTYYPMKSGTLVPLRSSQVVLGLAGAELPEVFGGPRDNIFEELEGNPAQRLTCVCRGKAC